MGKYTKHQFHRNIKLQIAICSSCIVKIISQNYYANPESRETLAYCTLDDRSNIT